MRVPCWTNQYSIDARRLHDPDLEAGLLGRPRGGRSARRSRRRRACPWAASRSRRRGSRRRMPTTSCGTLVALRTTIPPAEVARACPQARHGAAGALAREPRGPRRTAASASTTTGCSRPPVDGDVRRGRLDRARVARRWASGVGLVAQEHGQARRSRAEGAGRARGRAGARGSAPRAGRSAPRGGPRSWRRCCAPSPANGTASVAGIASDVASSRAAASGASEPRALGERELALGRARGTGAATSGASARQRRRGGASSVPTSPRVIGPVSAARMPERLGVAERLAR